MPPCAYVSEKGTIFKMENWASFELRESMLGKRLKAGVANLLTNLHSNPQSSFSVAAGNGARQTFGRLDAGNSSGKASSKDLLAGHVSQTARRCKSVSDAGDAILVMQDTTVFTYSHLKKMQGLGGQNSVDEKVMFGHSGLAVAETGALLGILHLDLYTRNNEEHGKGANRKNRPITEKESYRWLSTVAACEKQLPPDASVIYIADRESDIFPYFIHPRKKHSHLLLRAAHPRKVEIISAGGDRERTIIFDAISKSSVQGHVIVDVPRSANRENSQIKLSLQFEKMRLLPPLGNDDAGKEPVEVWVVRALEIKPPVGEKPIEWVLITTMSVESIQDAAKMVHYYTKRWLIERLHYTLKSGGCNVEKLQMETARAVELAITLYYMVAWRILQVTYAVRLNPDSPATELLSPLEIKILSHLEKKPVRTSKDVMIAVGRLGGLEPYKNGPPPGVKKLWLGFSQLDRLVQGANIALNNREAIQD